MNKEFVTYEQALALKELGFNEPCFAFYQIEYVEDTPVMVDDDSQYRISGFRTCKNTELPEHYTSAPTLSQAFRWFREKYQLQHNITWNKFYEKTPQQWEVRKQWIDEPIIPYGYGGMSKTYEEAETACIDKLIEIVKNGNKI